MDHHGGNQFESLKREATKLERQLEEKVARYQQVCIYILFFVLFLLYLSDLGNYVNGTMRMDLLGDTSLPWLLQISAEEFVSLTLDDCFL